MKKIFCIFVCMLMIITALPVVGARNVQNTSPTSSGIIEIKIVAKVFTVSDPYNLLEGVIHINDTITGKYVYDSGMPDSNPDPSVGEYYYTSSSCGIEVKAGGLVFKTNPSDVIFSIMITNNHIGTWDEFSVLSLNNLQLSNGMIPGGIHFHLMDFNGTAIDSDTLPTTAPVLEDWKSDNTLGLGGKDPSDPSRKFNIYAHVTRATKGKKVDINGAFSDWKTPSVTTPYLFNLPFMYFWIKLLERFPNAFPILRHLLEY